MLAFIHVSVGCLIVYRLILCVGVLVGDKMVFIRQTRSLERHVQVALFDLRALSHEQVRLLIAAFQL